MTLDFVSFAKKYAVAGIVIGIVLLVAMKKLGVFSKIKNMVRPDSKKKVVLMAVQMAMQRCWCWRCRC